MNPNKYTVPSVLVSSREATTIHSFIRLSDSVTELSSCSGFDCRLVIDSDGDTDTVTHGQPLSEYCT